MIPKIIWQTYETDFNNLPQGAKDFIKTWIKNNPSWEYRYMSGKEREEFILKEYGQEWYDLYKSYKVDVVRADLWRYLVLNKYGGLYSDLDIICYSPIESWMDTNKSFVVLQEPGDSDLSQMLFASSSNHPILQKIIDSIFNNINKDCETLIDYIRLTCGFTVFNNAITDFLGLDNNFDFAKSSVRVYNNDIQIYAGKDSLIVHGKHIKHFHAGYGKLWKDYTGWLTTKWGK
jgi:inositol phosphorylceramide mannosyltransferase catalytic subunit